MKSLYLKLLLFFPALFFAQIPVVETSDDKGNYVQNKEVILKKLVIETKITGKISTNIVTMVFRNNSARVREAKLTFPLPEGVNASGYALDINGKLRNAVPVEKEKAREVYETIKKQNVDPGILEKVEGNNFRTTIYPLNANGGERTIQITYNYELKKLGNSYEYFLPLNYTSEIPEFSIKTSVFQNTEAPKLEEKPDGNFNFVKNGNVWIAEINKTKYKPGSSLKINFPQNNLQSILMQKAADNSSYFLADINISKNEREKKLPENLAIIWDNSLSGKKRDHVKEFALLKEYFSMNKNLKVKIYFINNTFDEGKMFRINNGNWEELKTYLSQTTYDGGTDFGQLQKIKEDEIFFFSDGLSSFGELNLIWNKPTYTISSSNNVNFGQLKFISNKTGGEFLNLNENDPQKEVRKLLFQPLKFLGTEKNNLVSEVYPSFIQTVSEDFVLSGILTGNQTSVKVNFGYGNEITETKTILLNMKEQTVKDWDISKFWAQKKLTELEIFETKNKDEIKNISKQFGLVSNNMSLMVLENVEDYVKYDITPPQELKTKYDEIVKNKRIEKEEWIEDLMSDAEHMTEELKEWWKKDFKAKAKKTYPKPTSNEPMQIERPVETAVYNEVPVASNPAKAIESSPSLAKSDLITSDRSIEIEEVVTMGYNRVTRNESVTSSSVSATSDQITVRGVPSISSDSVQGRAEGIVVTPENASGIINSGRIDVKDVESNAEYMKLFKNAENSEKIYQAYLKNRKDYENLPQYYFDVSELLFKNNDKKTGLKVLSSIADLDIENEELYKLLAYRLKKAGTYGKELFITKKVLEWRPFDPQSYRDYALALEDNKLYQEALDNLYKVLTQSYTHELADRDDGIEEIVVMEINQLISNYRSQLNLKNINPKIIADLPVNIRVVINWNKDDTDIDLWVTDPNKELCMYSHPSTEIGGRLSNDFTQGFGPEQFLLKKAIKGKYKIQTNFYDENQVGIAGPTAIMAEIFINYATGKQERKIVVFQNQKEDNADDKEILIGEFEF